MFQYVVRDKINKNSNEIYAWLVDGLLEICDQIVHVSEVNEAVLFCRVIKITLQKKEVQESRWNESSNIMLVKEIWLLYLFLISLCIPALNSVYISRKVKSSLLSTLLYSKKCRGKIWQCFTLKKYQMACSVAKYFSGSSGSVIYEICIF